MPKSRRSQHHWYHSLPVHNVVAFLLAAFVSQLAPQRAYAQTVFDQNGFGGGRGTYSTLPYEHVDPLNGNLLVVTTDLVLPGNAGLDIVVQRVYNSAVYPNYASGGDKTLQEDSWAGVGWRLHFGRVLFENDNGSGKTKIEMGDGSQHALYTTPDYAAGWITKGLWIYDKTTHTLTLPNKRVYTFGRAVYIAGLGIVRYVTEIRDQFNNTLTFTYFDAGGPPDGVKEIHQDLGASPGIGLQARVVRFTYDPTHNSLASMAYGDSTWTYTQTAVGTSGYTKLDTVQPPAGAQPWRYYYENYNATGFVGLNKLQAPSGGEITYVYGDSIRVAGPGPTYHTQLSRVVTSRSVGGPPETKIEPGTWTFLYNNGPNKDETVVDCPCGKTVYRYAGIGTDATQTFESWRTGLLVERKVLGPLDTVLEREVQTWQRSEPVSPDAIPSVNGIWGDDHVYFALIKRKVIERGSKSWATDYEYRTNLGTFNDFGSPFSVTESNGTQTRKTDATYWYGAHHVAGRIASTKVTQGTETVSSSAEYDTTTTALISETINGVTGQYTYHLNGNLQTVTDPHGHVTTYPKYSWGVPVETQTPLLTTSRLVNDAGLVTREQIGSLITNYTYDQAFRPKSVVPADSNPTYYWYDQLWDGWTRVERGSAETHTVVDGFGRGISSVNQVGQKTRLKRDACGRVIFEALPYTNPIFADRGIATTYDALDRVTSTKFVGGGAVAPEATSVYDGLDVTSTDALGRVTKYEYTAIGGPSDAVLTAVVDAANQRTTYTYNIDKKIRQVGGAMPSRTWNYDAHGQLKEEVQPESGTTTHTYDAAGLLKTTTDSTGNTFTRTYDANDRLTVSDGPGTSSDVTLTYDSYGRLSTQHSADVTTTLIYDAGTGRLALRRDLFQGRTYETHYGYDRNDNVTSLTYPSGRVVTYSYDAENRLTSISQNGNVFAHSFLYDDGGGLAEYKTGAVTHRVEYDILQRVARVSSGAGTPALDLTYGYDAASQLSTLADPRYGTATFEYDSLRRLKQANGPWGVYSWTYDAAGNRLTEQMGGPTSFTYDPSKQRLTAFLTQTGGESYTYDNAGRLTADGRGTYGYTADGLLASVTAANLAATYVYDATTARILRTVNGIGYYSIRGAAGEILSEYEGRCGDPVWTRDIIYAGDRAIGSIKAPTGLPTVGLVASNSTVVEGSGPAVITVRLTTPTGLPTTCAVSVGYRATTHAGEAARGADFAGLSGTLSFPAGTASGATQTVNVTVHQDSIYETNERFVLDLTGATGATLGVASHVVTIANDDLPPSLTINDPLVTEAEGARAIFTLTLSASSAVQTEVNYLATSESATANADFAVTAGRVIFPPGEIVQHVLVDLFDDGHAELTETFQLQLSGVAHATLARTFGRATILDNEGPREPIDPSLPGTYFADVTSANSVFSYIAIFNPHAVNVTARLTFTKPNGTGVVRHLTVPALRRITVDLGAEPQIGGQGDASLAVQSLDASRPLVAESSGYWYGDQRGGRNTHGSVTPSHTWFFAEGATDMFDEYLTVFNPSNEPINVVMNLHVKGLGLQQYIVPILSGPGRVKVRVNDYGAAIEHGTSLTGLTLSGAPTPIVAERTMYWWGGDVRDGHSSNGVSAPAMQHFFAEGSTGAFTQFLTLMNPFATPSNVTAHYLYENGAHYQESTSIPAYGRAELSAAAMPAGSFAIVTESTNGVGHVAERSIYGGYLGTFGHAEAGAQSLHTSWMFAEGATGFFQSYLLLGNPYYAPAITTVTFRLETGQVITHNITVPARARLTVSLNDIPGLASATFAMEIAVTNGTPIVAERVMYWPTSDWNGAHVSLGRPW